MQEGGLLTGAGCRITQAGLLDFILHTHHSQAGPGGHSWPSWSKTTGRTGDAVGEISTKGVWRPPPVSGVGESRLADAGGERSAASHEDTEESKPCKKLFPGLSKAGD